MYKQILLPIDVADIELSRPAIEAALMMARESGGVIRLVNVLPMTPVMLAEYVPPDFDAQQRLSAEQAIAALAKEINLESGKVSTIVRQGGVWTATPLFITLLFVEITDIIFAVDSVPAIYALTDEPLIVFTSNVFAILGLRALYFLLGGAVTRFHMLKYGLALVLIFVGLKMAWLNDLWGSKFPIGASLAIIGALIGASLVLSLVIAPRPAAARPGADAR